MLLFESVYPTRGAPPMRGFPKDGYFDRNHKHILIIFACIFYHIPSIFKFFTLIKHFYMEIYVITPVTIFLPQRMKLQLHSYVCTLPIFFCKMILIWWGVRSLRENATKLLTCFRVSTFRPAIQIQHFKVHIRQIDRDVFSSGGTKRRQAKTCHDCNFQPATRK
jgi:hypothetical protein